MNGRALVGWLGSALLVGLPAAMTGCTEDAYCFANCGETAGSGGGTANGGSAGSINSGGQAGTINLSGAAGSAGSNGGSAGNAGSAGCVANLESDPANCGTCGFKCTLPGAFPGCAQGKCTIATCAPGRYDLNGKAEDGCEYACVPTTDPTEVCDAVDNNCNGQIDEGSDQQTDPKNCGACGVSCAADLPNASATACVKGLCAVTACADGYSDANQVPGDGCEYKCPVAKTDEICDGIDNDCDGNVDNGNPGGGQPCTETCPNGVCQGQCTAGTRQCAGNGNYLCIAGVGPSIETCDSIDNDCDGTVDNGFDLKSDPNNCGVCGKKCDDGLANVAVACDDGTCKVLACKPGFSDANNDPSDGCEYGCPTGVPGIEVCDGIDNDCNGKIDDNVIVPPAGFCNSKAGTPCAGTVPECQGAKGFVCPYGPDAEVDDNGVLRGIETRCDGKDGNCDGQVDETFPLVGKACDDGGIGACRGIGTYTCTSDQSSIACSIVTPGQSAPQTEACDGIDNDCNGQIDDNLPDTAFALVATGVGSVQVDAFEASLAPPQAMRGGAFPAAPATMRSDPRDGGW